jgi:hypothetical protein
MTKEHAHSELGTIIGLDHEKTIQYRGLKYASLEHPFAEPILFTNTRGSTVKATSYGYVWHALKSQPSSLRFDVDIFVDRHAHRIQRHEIMSSRSSNMNYHVKNPCFPVPNV